VAEVSTTEENVTSAAVVVRVTVPPSLIKFVPVIATVPEAPAAMVLAVAPWGVNANDVTAGTVAAPAEVAIAKGSAAAASNAPAAAALTKWRCIRLGLFIFSITPFIRADGSTFSF
jgi:hypothetical protein